MKTLYAMVSATAMVVAMAGAAGAVEIRDPATGDEMVNHNLIVTERGQERRVVLMSGETIRNLCDDCTIQVEGGKPVQASKDDMVEVRGSSLTVFRSAQWKPAALPQDTQQARLRALSEPTVLDKSDAMAAPEDGPEGSEN